MEGETGVPEKTLEAQERTNNSTHISCRVRESNPSHSGERRALSPLRHLCSQCTRNTASTHSILDRDMEKQIRSPGIQCRRIQFSQRFFSSRIARWRRKFPNQDGLRNSLGIQGFYIRKKPGLYTDKSRKVWNKTLEYKIRLGHMGYTVLGETKKTEAIMI